MRKFDIFMTAAQKKVIVQRTLGDSVAGYLPTHGFVEAETIPLLDLEGRLFRIPLRETKFIAFVRNFDLNEAAQLDRSLRRTFLARPRGEGLWIRVTFVSGDALEGLVAAGVSLLDEMLDLRGLQLTPPDTRANCQRIYVPRASILRLDMLGIVATASKRAPRTATAESVGQSELFGNSDERS